MEKAAVIKHRKEVENGIVQREYDQVEAVLQDDGNRMEFAAEGPDGEDLMDTIRDIFDAGIEGDSN